jgi:ATP-dependent RNA helicase DeaD
VFCRTRTEVDELTETLGARGYSAQALHGGLSQEQRDRVMRRFRDGTIELLVATDVAARGLDIEQVTHVLNYDVPSSPDAYVHRIGRTGRAGREGVAITLAEAREHRLLRNIEFATKRRISIEAVPTIHDLRARRLELTRAALEETLLAGDLDGYRVVVEALTEEYDVVDVAAAAVKLVRELQGADDEEANDIPPANVPKAHDGPPRKKREREPRRPREAPGSSRIYVGVGRKMGIRPGDLVGAIANEAGIDSKHIGAIDIADRFSLVEVPDEAVDDIIRALRSTTIRGKKVIVRRDREA